MEEREGGREGGREKTAHSGGPGRPAAPLPAASRQRRRIHAAAQYIPPEAAPASRPPVRVAAPASALGRPMPVRLFT